MLKADYTTNVGLRHNEVPVAKNQETGEIRDLVPKDKKVKEPKDKSKEYFVSSQSYQRHFTHAWNLLETQTTQLEYMAAEKLGRMAQAYTNSLEPLTPESTQRELSEHLKIGIHSVSKVIDKLFKLGVIAKFEVYNRNEQFQSYWIFNPYLSFNGITIKKSVSQLFSKTYYALVGSFSKN